MNLQFKRRFYFLRFWLNFFFVSSSNFATLFVDFFLFAQKFLFVAFVMSFMWNSFSIVLKMIKSNRSLLKSFKIVLDKNSKSKCCQKCIKFLIENSFFTCLFDVSRVVCNRCERLNVACMTIKMPLICR
jgi:hypothetical protein